MYYGLQLEIKLSYLILFYFHISGPHLFFSNALDTQFFPLSHPPSCPPPPPSSFCCVTYGQLRRQ